MTNSAGGLLAHQNRLSPDIEARLAQEVMGTRHSLPISALTAIYEDASGEFDKLVAASVLQHFLSESQTLFGFSQFFLESYQLRLMREQRILSLEDLVIELRNGGRQRVEVPNADGSLGNVFGSVQRDDGGADV